MCCFDSRSHVVRFAVIVRDRQGAIVLSTAAQMLSEHLGSSDGEHVDVAASVVKDICELLRGQWLELAGDPFGNSLLRSLLTTLKEKQDVRKLGVEVRIVHRISPVSFVS